jgi:hypothetical protein
MKINKKKYETKETKINKREKKVKKIKEELKYQRKEELVNIVLKQSAIKI